MGENQEKDKKDDNEVKQLHKKFVNQNIQFQKDKRVSRFRYLITNYLN